MKTKMYISCMLALMITAAAWAAEGPSSPQSKATASLNGTEADRFMSLTDWSTVNFDKLFTYAGFAQQNVNRNRNILDVGAAFKAGPVYIGAWYQGQFGNVSTFNNKGTTTTITESTVNPGTIDNTAHTNTARIQQSHDANHDVAVLIGFSNMGVRLGYTRTGKNNSGTYFDDAVAPDTETTNSKTPGQVNGKKTYDPKGYLNDADRTGTVDFGMNLSLGTLSVSPTVGLEFKVNQDSSYGVRTVTTKDETLGTSNITKTVSGSSRNDTKTTLTAKLGADLGLNDSLNSNFSFGYDFGIDIYGTKKHTAADGSTIALANSYTIRTDTHNDVVTAANQTITDTFKATASNKSNITNTLTVGYTMRKDFTDRLSLFAGVKAPIGFNFETEVKKGVDKTTTTTIDKVNPLNNNTRVVETETPATTVKTTTVTLSPSFKAALTYAAIPNRVFVSFGTEVKPFGQGTGKCEFKTVKTTVNGFTETTTTTTTYPNDSSRTTSGSSTKPVASTTESADNTVTYGKVTVDVNLGVRWNIVDAVCVDLAYNKSVLETINWTSIGNLKLACTIKF